MALFVFCFVLPVIFATGSFICFISVLKPGGRIYIHLLTSHGLTSLKNTVADGRRSRKQLATFPLY